MGGLAEEEADNEVFTPAFWINPNSEGLVA